MLGAPTFSCVGMSATLYSFLVKSPSEKAHTGTCAVQPKMAPCDLLTVMLVRYRSMPADGARKCFLFLNALCTGGCNWQARRVQHDSVLQTVHVQVQNNDSHLFLFLKFWY